jgi:hypothetical protein
MSITVEICASRFYSYSVDEIRLLDPATLQRLLSSPSLSIKSEDTHLRLLIEVDCEARILGLHRCGISLFAGALSIDDLTELIWAKIVLRLKRISGDVVRARRFHSASVVLSQIPDFLSDLGSGR